MNNQEKASKIAKQHKLNYTVRYNGITHTDSSEAECYNSAMDMAQWKDEQVKHLLIEKTKPLSSSAAQDSVKRCTIEEIYRELFNEEMPNSNPYIK